MKFKIVSTSVLAQSHKAAEEEEEEEEEEEDPPHRGELSGLDGF